MPDDQKMDEIMIRMIAIHAASTLVAGALAKPEAFQSSAKVREGADDALRTAKRFEQYIKTGA